MRAVPVFSAPSLSRYHEAIGMRRSRLSEVSPTSKTMSPNPPPWSSRSVALSACSGLALQLTQSSRLS